jgi:hypothetical protein
MIIVLQALHLVAQWQILAFFFREKAFPALLYIEINGKRPLSSAQLKCAFYRRR